MLGIFRAVLIKSKISLTCSKSFIEQSDFLLEKSKSIFVPNELSFENSHSWKTIGFETYRDFSFKICFHRKFDIFSSKSQEKSRISVKDVCITFAQYCRTPLIIQNNDAPSFPMRPPLSNVNQNVQVAYCNGPTDEQRRKVEAIVSMGSQVITTAKACVDGRLW